MIVLSGTAQNLVPNWSFEDSINCPKTISQLSKTEFWTSPTIGTPDYFHSCSVSSVGVPSNPAGEQFSVTGEAYIGIYTFLKYEKNLREYIQVNLLDTLLVGKKYLVEFYISLGDNINYASNNIGVHFSDTAISDTGMLPLSYIPQIENKEIITNKSDWTKISGTYIANGNEIFMTIGNFRTDSLTDTVYVGGGNFTWDNAYYYIDDVTVEPITCSNDTTELNFSMCLGDSLFYNNKYYSNQGIYFDTLTKQAGCDSILKINIFFYECKIIIPNTITPNGDGFNDLWQITTPFPDSKITQLSIWNRWGYMVYKSDNYQNDFEGKGIDGNDLPAGIYYYLLVTENIQYKGYLSIIK